MMNLGTYTAAAEKMLALKTGNFMKNLTKAFPYRFNNLRVTLDAFTDN